MFILIDSANYKVFKNWLNTKIKRECGNVIRVYAPGAAALKLLSADLSTAGSYL